MEEKQPPRELGNWIGSKEGGLRSENAGGCRMYGLYGFRVGKSMGLARGCVRRRKKRGERSRRWTSG